MSTSLRRSWPCVLGLILFSSLTLEARANAFIRGAYYRLGEGPGSASRSSMAKVIVGGQALSLLLTLLVTPVAYSIFDDLSLWRKRRQDDPTLPVATRAPELEPVAR